MNSEPIEDLDVPPLSSYTVTELRQLLSLTTQTYEAYKSQDTPSGKIGATLCHEEMKEIEAILSAAASASAAAAASAAASASAAALTAASAGNPPPSSPPACTQDTAKGTEPSEVIPEIKPEELSPG